MFRCRTSASRAAERIGSPNAIRESFGTVPACALAGQAIKTPMGMPENVPMNLRQVTVQTGKRSSIANLVIIQKWYEL